MRNGLIINSYGDKEWYLNDKRHREDGPARELSNSSKAWYINDKLHRKDGPAIEFSNGDKAWFLNDIEYTEQEHWNLTHDYTFPEKHNRLDLVF